VHQLGLRLFVVVVWKLLSIESFTQCELNLKKFENHIGISGVLGVVGKPSTSQIK
jgi:hypothetical protein